MNKESHFEILKESYRNFLKSFKNFVGEKSESKIDFESTLYMIAQCQDDEQEEFLKFSKRLCCHIFHYGDELLSQLKQIYEETLPAENKIYGNWE